jgi:hypothetical protein
MNSEHLETFAKVTGIAGIVIAALTGLSRLVGLRALLGFENLTLMIGAIALMAASCVVQLHLLRQR